VLCYDWRVGVLRHVFCVLRVNGSDYEAGGCEDGRGERRVGCDGPWNNGAC
jgi:hypothetical protein